MTTLCRSRAPAGSPLHRFTPPNKGSDVWPMKRYGKQRRVNNDPVDDGESSPESLGAVCSPRHEPQIFREDETILRLMLLSVFFQLKKMFSQFSQIEQCSGHHEEAQKLKNEMVKEAEKRR